MSLNPEIRDTIEWVRAKLLSAQRGFLGQESHSIID
jgi:hypothetical protein